MSAHLVNGPTRHRAVDPWLGIFPEAWRRGSAGRRCGPAPTGIHPGTHGTAVRAQTFPNGADRSSRAAFAHRTPKKIRNRALMISPADPIWESSPPKKAGLRSHQGACGKQVPHLNRSLQAIRGLGTKGRRLAQIGNAEFSADELCNRHDRAVAGDSGFNPGFRGPGFIPSGASARLRDLAAPMTGGTADRYRGRMAAFGPESPASWAGRRRQTPLFRGVRGVQGRHKRRLTRPTSRAIRNAAGGPACVEERI